MAVELTKAHHQTLIAMPDHDTAYSSASVAHRRWRGPSYTNLSCSTQRRLLRTMREIGLVAMVDDYSGDMWAVTDAGREALARSKPTKEGE